MIELQKSLLISISTAQHTNSLAASSPFHHAFEEHDSVRDFLPFSHR